MFEKLLRVTLVMCVVLGLAVASSALGATVTYVGMDTTTHGDWRTTTVAKPLDGDGDNAYGTDGWRRHEGCVNPVSQPSYATLTFQNGNYENYAYREYNSVVDQALTPAASVADDYSIGYFKFIGVNGGARNTPYDLGLITMSAAKTFRVAVFGDNRNTGSGDPGFDPAYGDSRWYGIYQVGGTADSGDQLVDPHRTNGKWLVFEITAAAGDVFAIRTKFAAPAWGTDLSIVAFDSVPVSGPELGQYWAGGGGGGVGLWTPTGTTWSKSITGSPAGAVQSTTDTLEFGANTGIVTIGSTVTVNNGLKFTTNNYEIAGEIGKKLTLAGAAANNKITTNTNVTATINAEIAGTDGMIKDGEGRLVLKYANTYTGGTNVVLGTLELQNANALKAGENLTIGASGTVVLASDLTGAAAVNAATSATAVPEPGTIALLAAGLAGLLVVAWRRRRL